MLWVPVFYVVTEGEDFWYLLETLRFTAIYGGLFEAYWGFQDWHALRWGRPFKLSLEAQLYVGVTLWVSFYCYCIFTDCWLSANVLATVVAALVALYGWSPKQGQDKNGKGGDAQGKVDNSQNQDSPSPKGSQNGTVDGFMVPLAYAFFVLCCIYDMLFFLWECCLAVLRFFLFPLTLGTINLFGLYAFPLGTNAAVVFLFVGSILISSYSVKPSVGALYHFGPEGVEPQSLVNVAGRPLSAFIGGLEALGLVIKIISLSLRLIANLSAGHILTGLLYGNGCPQGLIHSGWVTLLVFPAGLALLILEVCVCYVQGFVFCTLL